jgi:hypothetical protein
MKIGYEQWNAFVDKYEGVYLNGTIKDVYILHDIRKEFQQLSIEYWKNCMKEKTCAESLSKIWCEFRDMVKKNNTYQEYYDYFIQRMNYSSDRMHVNRWLHANLALQEAFNIAYSQYITTQNLCHEFFVKTEQIA